MANGIDASFGSEKKNNVKDEGSEGDNCSKTGDTSTTIRHGHFANMGKKTKDGRYGRKCEANDMKKESIG